MTIYFNTEWDGAPWSDQPAALGTLKTGPLGMLSVLESRCGTSGTHLPHAARVAGTMAALAQLPADWFSSSFASDPWATAVELLSFRDELLTARIAAGCTDPVHHPALPRTRLQTLTALTDNPHMPGDGLPDRIIDTLHELRSAEFCTLHPMQDLRIVVEEPQALLPPVWRTLFDALPAAGGVVEYVADTGTDTDAGLTSGHRAAALTVVTATDEWQAAEHLASLLSNLEETDPAAARGLALVVSGDGDALDWTLQRRGLPVTGVSGESAARWGLQILPAFLSTLWSPADPLAIASFLSLAAGLVPAAVSRELLHALSEHPGTGGKKWTTALEKITAANDRETADLYDRFFSGELYRPDAGVPVSVLDERLAWLHRLLAGHIDRRETVRVILGHIAELRGILGRLSTDPACQVPRALLDRIVGTVVHPVSAGRDAHAALWSVHRSSATVPSATDTLVYWNCTDAEPAVAHRFTDQERELLAKAGYLLESPEIVRSRREWNRHRALSVPERHIVAFIPQQIRGAETESAPWLAELERALSDAVSSVDLSAEQSTVDIAGITVVREESVPAVPQEPASVHHVPPGAIGYPETLSYSRIQSLIGCPVQWTLGTITQLSEASNVSLPTGNQMIGTLTHKIIERIAEEHAPEGVLPEDSGALAATLFDELVPAMAAELLLPGRGLARQRYREVVIAAVTALREVILRLGLTITQVETFLKASWELSIDADTSTLTVTFRGPADMELADEAGNPFVLDLKYSYGETYYTDLVSRGQALQLASYAWLIEQHSRRRAIGSGYFLLPRHRLITDSPRAGDDAVASHRTLAEIWRRGEHSVIQALRRLHTDGIVAVTGLQEAEGDDAAGGREETIEESGGLYVKPPCRFCDYPVICGYRRGQI
ncbi:MAG: PD-(D/E)XK nuclease family protein [Spirochaeta sp.]|jgi:ATP-dependent helicase/nuclease subunit B|nr:PD-(D/E)XK nuclease family protein [Spirochaeta sp.]